MMMSKIKFDVNTMTLTVSKQFWKNASVPFSPEYETIKRILQDYPRCRIELRQTASHHNPYRNPSYNMMEAYIQAQPNADERVLEGSRFRQHQPHGLQLCPQLVYGKMSDGCPIRFLLQ